MRFIILFFAFLLMPLSLAQAQEGAGLLVSDLNGALPKGLWRDQNRSEIIYLLKNLPTRGSTRGHQEIKRNMLLSTYDPSLIENDVNAELGENLLTLRLEKLTQMGLWDDAFKLYTQTTEDPGNNNLLAQVGLLLVLHQKGLSTACLEEKVLNARFSDDPFWQQMDKVCMLELGIESDENKEFTDSPTLQSLFFNNSFKIKANDIETLKALTPLEISIAAVKDKINYDSVDLTQEYPPFIIKLFLEDENFPTSQRTNLENQARNQGILPLLSLSETETEWLETPETLTQTQILQLISRQLELNLSISESLVSRLNELSAVNVENHYFLQILDVLGYAKGLNAPEEDKFNQAIEKISENYPQDINYLQYLLDKPAEFSNNPASVYEKQISLTPDDGYVMSTESLTEWLNLTTQHRLSGLSLVIILSNDERIDANGNEGNNPVKILSTVGLINQAHHLAKERLAALMRANI